MKTVITVFQTADGLTLHQDKKGNYYVANRRSMLSILGALLIDANSHRRQDRIMASGMLNSLKKSKVYSLDMKESYDISAILS